MPKITQRGDKGQIRWTSEDWLSGLNKDSTGGTSVFIGNTLTNGTIAMNPFLTLGAAAPGALPNTVTNDDLVTDFLTNSVVENQHSYANSNDGKIHKINSLTGAVTSDATFPHTISPASGNPIGDDILTYRVDDTDYAFYSWYSNATNAYGNVGRYDFSTTFDDGNNSVAAGNLAGTTEATSGTLVVGQRYLIQTFQTGDDFTNVGASSNATDVVFVATATTPTTWTNSSKLWKVFNPAVPLPMIVGSDDILYIADGNKVHGFDGQTGTDGTLSFDVFKLPNQFIVSSFIAVEPNLLAIFAYRKNDGGSLFQGKCKVYFWNMIDEDPTRVIDIDDNFIRAAFSFNGTIGCFTEKKRNLIVNEKNSRIRLFDGTRFKAVETFQDTIPINGGVESFSNHIMFNSSGKIYIWGSVKDGLSNSLHYVSKKGSTTAMLSAATGNSTLISSNTSNERISLLNKSTFIETAVLQTISAFPPFPTGKQGKIELLTIVFANSASGGRSIDVRLQVDIDRLDKEILASTSTILNSNLIQKFHEFTDGSLLAEDFAAIALKLTWAAGSGSGDTPKVKEIIIDYSLSDIEAA